MAKKEINLISTTKRAFGNLKKIDLNYRGILAIALSLAYKSFFEVDEETLKSECENAGIQFDENRKLQIILEICISKPQKKAPLERYKARLRMYTRALKWFIGKDMEVDQVEKKLKVYGVEYFANPRDKEEQEIEQALKEQDDEDEGEVTGKKHSRTTKTLSEQTLNFFNRHNVKLTSFVVFAIGNDVYCSNDEGLIEELRKYKKGRNYEFDDINKFSKQKGQ